MPGKRHRIGGESRTIETEDRSMKWVISGDYVWISVSGAPVFDEDGTLMRHFDLDVTPLTDGEWSPSARLFPTWVEFELRGRDYPDFHCKVELRDDVPRMVEFGWRARENQEEIRQKHLRAIEVSAILSMVYGMWVVELRDVWRDKGGLGIPTELGSEQERVVRGLLYDMRAGRRHVNAELLKQVADVYRANFHKAPAEAVARTFGVKPRMAHEYVRRARERGFLPPTTQGKKKM
ncbi:hypothetical protein A5791_15845 [Mycobacterium sp. 852002-51163_SCH5372311]|nr:hypothetical protein A5791_15845 [Mycobacterium sp. 852002-51163_SCH5372311]